MKTKIPITCVFSLGLLVLGGPSIESFLHKDYVNALFFFAFFVFIAGILSEMWYKSPKIKRQELLFKQRIQIIEYIARQKKGTKDEFCQKYGIEMYNDYLDQGFIHEPFDCNSDKICWEATRLAQIRKLKIDQDKKKGIL